MKNPIKGAIVPNMGTRSNGLATALFTKTQRRVLGLLFGNPDRSYYAKELMRLACTGTGAVQRELEKLADVGLVNVKKVGNQKHYQANRNSPIFDEIHSIAVKTFGVADILRQSLEPVSERIQVALIFGSVAKGSDTVDSDIDVLIVSSDLSYPDLFTVFSKAEHELGRTISPVVYTSAELQRKLKADSAFLGRVLKQPVIFLIGSDDELKRTR